MRVAYEDRVYDLSPDDLCWRVSEVRVAPSGREWFSNPTYPGRLDQALRTLIDRMVRDATPPDADLETLRDLVTTLYATIASASLPRTFPLGRLKDTR